MTHKSDTNDDDQLGEVSEMMDRIDSQIDELQKKVEKGRVYSKENEEVRIKWHRTLLDALREKRKLLQSTPEITSENNTSDEKSVYIIEGGGVYKIGVSKKPRERMKEIQRHSPQELNLRFQSKSTTDAYQIEDRIHTDFSDKNHHNEWFDLSDSELAEVIKITQKLT